MLVVIVFEITHWIEAGGIALVAAIVFAESGLLIGFFLPGDTLLFSAGFLVSQGKISIYWLIVAIVSAAIVGDNVGYSIGKRLGQRLFTKGDGLIFRRKNVQRAEAFYDRHGGKTIILARFVPVIRTFAPMIAGVGSMTRRRFFIFNVIGALFWGAGVTLTGCFLGSSIPNIETYIMPALLAATLLTFGPTIIHLFKDQKIRQATLTKIRLWWRRITLKV